MNTGISELTTDAVPAHRGVIDRMPSSANPITTMALSSANPITTMALSSVVRG
ncbi:hypothetical protein [Streptosporangium amethystogenes]|uniref:hypothetical protein n=1 Tax=Streptosporangium amethystogenes TaxID=2002 RepID=UPI0012F863DC|nr:hypothetical protein [Streptosporangium amethystogenes]